MIKHLLTAVMVLYALHAPLHGTIYTPEQLTTILNQFPRLSLSTTPSPLVHLPKLSAHLNTSLVMKDDAQLAQLNQLGSYGGNKVRKLELLLADALIHHAHTVITFGCIGSNHVAATATLCKQLGLCCHAYLLPQPKHPAVDATFAYTLSQQAHVHCFTTDVDRIAAAVKHALDEGVYVIPTGGSNALGCLGFIFAALELHAQMQEHSITFDALYLAGGSLATAVGLWIGLSALGVRIPIIITYVNDKPFAQAYADLITLTQQTITFIKQADARFSPELDHAMIHLVEGYCGAEYGACTEKASAACQLMRTLESVELDLTYTGKCLAHLIDDCRAHRISKDATILFWNTFYQRYMT